MFKKTLLASAILATTAFGANAATLVVANDANISVEGTSATTKRVNLKTLATSLTFKLEAAAGAAKDDTFVFDFTGGVLLGAPTVTIAGATVTTHYTVTATTTSVTIKVVDASKFAKDQTIVLTDLDFIASTIANKDKMTVAGTFRKSNGVINPDEKAVAAKTFATFVNQFEVKNKGSFDAKIDVANKRETFEKKATTDTLSLAGSKTANSANVNTAKLNTAKLELTSPTFAGVISAVNKAAAKGVLSADKGTYTWSYDTAGIPSDEVITLGVETATDKKAALAARTFNAKATYSYTADGKNLDIVLLNGAVGAWKLNGSMVSIPYMPYGDTISQIIYLNNTGTVSGEISVDYITDKGVKGNFSITEMAKAKEVVAVAGAIKKGLEDDGFKTGKAKIDIVVNTPTGSISAFTGYNVGGNSRVVVANSTTHDLNQGASNGLASTLATVKTDASTAATKSTAAATDAASIKSTATSVTDAINKAARQAAKTAAAGGPPVVAVANGVTAADAVCDSNVAGQTLKLTAAPNTKFKIGDAVTDAFLNTYSCQ